MKITKVFYQKTYSIGPYLTDRVGFEAEPEGNPGDAPMDMLSMLHDLADEWHKAQYPEPPGSEVWKFGDRVNRTDAAGPLGNSIPTISKDFEKLEIAIDNAQAIEELQILKDDAWKHGLSVQYITKFNELNNGRPTDFSEGLG